MGGSPEPAQLIWTSFSAGSVAKEPLAPSEENKKYTYYTRKHKKILITPFVLACVAVTFGVQTGTVSKQGEPAPDTVPSPNWPSHSVPISSLLPQPHPHRGLPASPVPPQVKTDRFFMLE